jgi:hypothetical protein
VRKKFSVLLFLIVAFPIISSCSGLNTSQEEFDAVKEELALFPDSINDDFMLPLPTDSTFSVSWSSPTLSITNNFIRYPFPFMSQDHVINATIRKWLSTEVFNTSIHVRSRLDAPLTNQVPALFINLPGNSREDDIVYESYLTASVSTREYLNGTSIQRTDYESLGIRTRGHSTRFMPKRPYRIRFDRNTSLFGMKSAKNYILLANYADKSLMRNALMMHLAFHLQEHLYPLEYRMIDVYINNFYRGVYLLTERVEFHPNRLNIESDTSVLDAGFMVELDQQVYVQNQPNEGLDWFKLDDVPYAIAEPNTDENGYTIDHTTYIREYFESVRDALQRKSGYESLIDVDNWIDYFIVQEWAKNVDVGWGSVYMVKEKNGLLKHMPLWDFDLAFGNADYIDYGPTGFWGFETYNKNPLFTLMMRIPAIRTRFKNRLQSINNEILPKVLSWWDAQVPYLSAMAETNFNRWSILYTYVWPNPNEIAEAGYATQLSYVRNYFTSRMNWLLQNL